MYSFTKSLKTVQLEIQIPFGALPQIINVALAGRRHREHIASDGLGVDTAATRQHHRYRNSAGDNTRITMIGMRSGPSGWSNYNWVSEKVGRGHWYRQRFLSEYWEFAQTLCRIHGGSSFEFLSRATRGRRLQLGDPSQKYLKGCTELSLICDYDTESEGLKRRESFCRIIVFSSRQRYDFVAFWFLPFFVHARVSTRFDLLVLLPR